MIVSSPAVLAVATADQVARLDADALPYLEARYVWADSRNDAGQLVAVKVRPVGCRGTIAAIALQVATTDARSKHANEHFAGPRLWRGHSLDADVGATVEECSLHRYLLFELGHEASGEQPKNAAETVAL